METSATLRVPQKIHYGRNAFERIGSEAKSKGTKALIISDQVMEDLGYIKQACTYLRREKMKYAVYLGIQSEPTDTYVSEALDVYTKESCDVVISLGGGSCIDTAKAVAVVATNGGAIADYIGGKKVANVSPAPHLAVPTTAGTGSEATDATVITNTTNYIKMMIKQPAFLPNTAIVDPLLTLSSPKSVTAATGVDALSHAIEAYLSRQAHPMTDTFALSAMEFIVNNLQTVYKEPEHVGAREAMSLGALQAGIAFSNASVCLVHGMSRPIGALFHVPHGFSNAMLLPAVLEYSRSACIDRLADLGRIFDRSAVNQSNDEAANIAVASVKQLCSSLNIPNLQTWGINKEDFESAIPKMATDALASGSPMNNPSVPSHSDIEALYKVCYTYSFSDAM